MFDTRTDAQRQGIASQQHDLDKIKVDGLPGDDGGEPSRPDFDKQSLDLQSWDAYETGISAGELESAWEQANSPEAREALRQRILESSKVRSGAFVRPDGTVPIIVAGEPAWHQLGYTMMAPFSAEQTKALVFNYNYEIRQTFDEMQRAIPNLRYVEVVESDGSRTALPGVGVGKKFAVVQPAEFVDWFAKIVDSIENARFTAAGSVDDYKRIWIQATLPEVLEPIRGDVTHHRLCGTDVFDSTGSQKVISTADRMVCLNTYRLIMGTGATIFRNRHTTNIRVRMDAYAKYIAGCRAAWQQFADLAHVMVAREVTIGDFASRVFIETLGVTEANDNCIKALAANAGADEIVKLQTLLEKRKNKVVTAVEFVRNIAESDTNTARGTVWGAFQSVTEFANHGISYGGNDASRGAFNSVMLDGGRADQINQQAREVAQTLCA